MKDKESMNKEAKAAGFYLRERYIKRGTEHKIPGLCYRLLNGLKTNNRTTVMDTILNMYLYAESPVSNVIVKMLDNNDNLEQFGYAFTAGLLMEKAEKTENNNSDGGDK